MAKLIVTEFVTLDGVIEAPGGEPTHPHTGWTMDYHGPEQEEYKLNEVLEAESHLLGRVTYESFSAAWPTYEGLFADTMNSMPKFVISSTLEEPLTWNNSAVLRGDMATEVTKLKEQGGGPILVAGSGTLVHGLVDAGLVDELRLMVYPLVIGGGLRLFPDNRRKHQFTLVDTTPFPSGVTVYTYHPATT